MIYSRKWTRMSWWHSMKYLKKYQLIETPYEYPIFHQYPPSEEFFGSLTKNERNNNQDYLLVSTLLNKYPELCQVPLNRDLKAPGSAMPDTNYIFNFIKKQKSLIKQGFTESKAFEMTEKLYQERIQRKIDQNRVARGLAINNRARSFMNIYQQQAEYEAKLKVLRLERDMSKYEQARADFKKKLEEWRDEEENPVVEGLEKEEDLEKQELAQIQREQESPSDAGEGPRRYTRVIEKIMTAGSEGSPALSQKEVIQNFIDRTKNLFTTYYDRAAMLDKLSGLTDAEIKNQIRETPSKLKKRTRLLRKKLEKHGIKLSEGGEVDYSKCDNENIIKKFKNDPMVKIALMAADLQFEFPHQEEEIKKAMSLRNRLDEVEENNEEDPRDAKARQEEEQVLQESQSSEDKKEQGLSKEEEKKYKEQILEKGYQEGKIYYPKEQTFRLIETYTERMARLEKKWLESRIAQLENPNEESSKAREDKLNAVVSEFRRLKFRIEQEAGKKAERTLFEEHEVLSQEELNIDAGYPFEKLEMYLNMPSNMKRLTQKQETEDKLIMKMISPHEVEEDLVEIGFENDFKRKIYPRDSSDYKEMMLENQREEERLRDYRRNSKMEFKTIDTHEDVDEDDKMGIMEDKKDKDEKKKIADFIKKEAKKNSSKKEEKTAAAAKDTAGKKDKKDLAQEVMKGAGKKKK